MSQTYSYNLSGPPRPVPWPIRAQAMFGGVFSQFGWLWLGFTMIFLWLFGGMTSFNGLFFLVSNVDTAQGVVSTIGDTGASENETPVYANHYAFRVERLEQDFHGISYTTGQTFSEGERVTIEYLSNNPDISRIQGARSGTFSPWVLCFVGIFPLIGIIFVAVSLVSGFKANRLLTHGRVALGTLINKEPTNTRINNQTVYKLTFEFTADTGQRYEATARSHQPYALEDEPQEQLLYDPQNPKKAVLLDSLPGEPDIDEWGNIQVANIGRSIRSLILPAAVLVINALIFVVVIRL